MTELTVPDDLHLKAGAHSGPDDGFCVMEAWTHIRGLDWTDAPDCASPVIASFLRTWNDSLRTDDDRDRLLMRFVTVEFPKGTDEDEHQRSLMALDWLIRVHTPAFLDLVPSLARHAKALRESPEITDENASNIGQKVRAARDAAWDAAGDAAWVAARSFLAPVVETLQASAVELVQRMAEVGQ